MAGALGSHPDGVTAHDAIAGAAWRSTWQTRSCSPWRLPVPRAGCPPPATESSCGCAVAPTSPTVDPATDSPAGGLIWSKRSYRRGCLARVWNRITYRHQTYLYGIFFPAWGACHDWPVRRALQFGGGHGGCRTNGLAAVMADGRAVHRGRSMLPTQSHRVLSRQPDARSGEQRTRRERCCPRGM
jgi:hypothetical protein